MRQFDSLVIAILNIQIWGLFKIFIVVGLFIYLLFSLVIIRQVDLMTGVLSGKLNPSLRVIALIHFVATLLVFLASLLIL